MEESFDGNDNEQLEDCIKKIIIKIKENRNRPCYQNILTFMNRRGKEIEMIKLKEILDGMIDRGEICNKGKEGNESFYLVEEHCVTEIRDEDKAGNVRKDESKISNPTNITALK